MRDDYERALDDCALELRSIRDYVNENRFDSKTPYLLRYAVIKASGTIELVFKGIVADKVSVGASPEVRFYFDRDIRENSANPSFGRMKGLLEKFGDSDTPGAWANVFDSKVTETGKQHISNLKSLVNDRNSFAHGGNIGSTIEQVITYFQSGRTILDCLDATLNP